MGEVIKVDFRNSKIVSTDRQALLAADFPQRPIHEMRQVKGSGELDIDDLTYQAIEALIALHEANQTDDELEIQDISITVDHCLGMLSPANQQIAKSEADLIINQMYPDAS